MIRTGDIVFHAPTGEEWVVAWADHQTGYMAPCGWPECEARIEDCELRRAASDESCLKLVGELAKSGRRDALKAKRIMEAQYEWLVHDGVCAERRN